VREATAKYIVLFSFYLFPRCEAKPGLDWFFGSKPARLSNICSVFIVFPASRTVIMVPSWLVVDWVTV
jgi:hypothetical protein